MRAWIIALVGAVVCILWYSVNQQVTPHIPITDVQPQWEWKARPVQKFAIAASSSRTATWNIAREAKAKFFFRSTVPVDFAVTHDGQTICGPDQQMLEVTVECDLPAGESVVSFVDTRTPGVVAASAALGLITRSNQTVAMMSPGTITLNTSFFVCTRNCPAPKASPTE